MHREERLMQSRSGNIQSSAAPLVVVGGALALISSFLLWFSLEFEQGAGDNNDYNGLDLEALGYGMIVFGAALIVLGAVQYWKGAGGGGKGAAIASIVVSVI